MRRGYFKVLVKVSIVSYGTKAPRPSKAETEGSDRSTATRKTHLTQCAVAKRKSVSSGLASMMLQHAFAKNCDVNYLNYIIHSSRKYYNHGSDHVNFFMMLTCNALFMNDYHLKILVISSCDPIG